MMPFCDPGLPKERGSGVVGYIFHIPECSLIPQRVQLTLQEEMKIQTQKANINIHAPCWHRGGICLCWAQLQVLMGSIHSVFATAHFHVGKPRHRKAEGLAPGHTATWQGWDLTYAARVVTGGNSLAIVCPETAEFITIVKNNIPNPVCRFASRSVELGLFISQCLA